MLTPDLSCLKNTGPFDVNLIIRVIIGNTIGKTKRRTDSEKRISKILETSGKFMEKLVVIIGVLMKSLEIILETYLIQKI